MMMMMIMIAGFVDSITTPIKSWLDNNTNDKTIDMTVKVVEVHTPRVDCIVCLSEVALGDRCAVLGRCKHGFHVECVEAWLKDHPNCPLCRTRVSGAGHGHDHDHQHQHQHQAFLKKSYETMTHYGFRVLETIAAWLTSSFSQGLRSSLTESCNYL